MKNIFALKIMFRRKRQFSRSLDAPCPKRTPAGRNPWWKRGKEAADAERDFGLVE